MGFKVDYSNANSGGVPAGVYEAVILAAFEDLSKTNKEFINMPLIVRNDVEQPCKNQRIFHRIYKKVDPTQNDAAHGGYPATQIDSISKAAGLANGKQYASLEEWLKDLERRPLRVKVKHEDYNGATMIKVDVFAADGSGITATRFPDVKHVYKDDSGAGAGAAAKPLAGFTAAAAVDDDDIPF